MKTLKDNCDFKDISVRQALEEDVAELIRLNILFNGESSNSKEAVELSIRDNKQEQVFVAEFCGRLIGFCCVQVFKSFCYRSNYAEITELFIEEPYRRKGVGARLMTYAEKYYSDKNIAGFQLFTGEENLVAQRFYESLGYSKTSEIMYRKRK